MLHINGYPDRPPIRAAVPVTDMVTGIYGALGAAMALLARRDTGKGQCIDAALFESAFSLMEAHVPTFEKLGVIAMRAGSRLPGSTRNNLYPTADGGYIAMAASSNPVFRRHAKVMGQPELADDPRFATGLARVENEDALDAVIGSWTRKYPLEELEPMLQRADVPASRVFTMADIFRDPHFAARSTIVHAPDEQLGTVALTAPVPRLSETPGRINHSGGETGADTVAVLKRYAGVTDSELQHLLNEKIALDAKRSAPAHEAKQVATPMRKEANPI